MFGIKTTVLHYLSILIIISHGNCFAQDKEEISLDSIGCCEKLKISIPEVPDHLDLSKGFELLQFFQDNSIFYYSREVNINGRIDQAINNHESCIMQLLQKQGITLTDEEISPKGLMTDKRYDPKPKLFEIIDCSRPYWKQKWGIDLPEWYPPLKEQKIFERKIGGENSNHLKERHTSNRGGSTTDIDFSKMDFGDQVLVFDYGCSTKNFIPPLFNMQRNDQKESYLENPVLSGESSVMFLFSRKIDGIYMVIGYQNLDPDLFLHNTLDCSKIRLRYVFMGYQKKLIGRTTIFSRYPTGHKRSLDPAFSPTGSIVFIDEVGHPTHYYSVKDGKFLGPQIVWNAEGKITKYENLTEPGESCENVWLEFYVK